MENADMVSKTKLAWHQIIAQFTNNRLSEN